MSNYKVCILAAGPSRRVGDFSEHVHKAVLPVGGKAVISHIVDKFPEDVEVVIAVGHRKDTIVDYLTLAYPQRKFTFVEVERYIGPGTGPGRSLLECRDHLRCPFVMVAADTIVGEASIPEPHDNWLGVAPTSEPEKYCTVKVAQGRVTEMRDKEKCDNTHAFIGLAGVKDHEKFFVALQTDEQARAGEIQVSNGFRALLGDLRERTFTWFDTGDLEGFKAANAKFAGDEAFDFSKTDEFLYFVGNRVIKFFADATIAGNRVKRAKVLEGMCPPLVGSTKHFYAYEKIPGKVLYDALDPKVANDFFAWASQKLWKPITLDKAKQAEFKTACGKFYKDKTLQRAQTFFTKTGTVDIENVVNGERVPPLKTLLSKVDWDYVCDGVPALFHGDLQFDNILLTEGKGDQRFVLLDWRQDFAGLTDFGDLYYDLAKVYGGLILSYKAIKQNKFTCDVRGHDVRFDFHTPEALAEIRAVYEKFLADRGFDFHKVQLLTALIFLNMSPLHHAPFDVMLFHLARSLLKKTLGANAVARKSAAVRPPPLLCIGPMSKEVVDTVIDFSFQNAIPMCLIASRSQVETQALGGGYANNWCTEDFAAYVRERLKETPADVLICRDHGGPWLGADEKTLAEKHAMLACKASYEADIAAGFNMLHIDTSVNPGGFDMEASLRRAFELMSFCEEKARQYGTKLNYEIGTEDADGGIVEPEQFEHFLSRIVKFCEEKKINKPRFIVGRTGSHVRELYQVGSFHPDNTRSLLTIAGRYGVGIKEHNADYDSAENHQLRARVGVTAINVAPEFGVLQTRVVLEHCRRKGRADLYEKFIELAYSSKKWKKWLRVPDLTTREEKAIIAGHYVFGTAAFKDIAKELGSELEEDVRRAIRHKLDWYARHLGLYAGREIFFDEHPAGSHQTQAMA